MDNGDPIRDMVGTINRRLNGIHHMKRSWPAFLAVYLFGSMGGAGSAQAGLFDFLFGVPSRDTAYAPQPLQNRSGGKASRRASRVERLSASADRANVAPERNLIAIRKLADVARDQGIQAAFAQDPTLRAGDILVTPAGIVVFEGGDSHRESNFRPLLRSRLKNRADLALLQKISGFDITLSRSDAMPPLVIQQRGRRAASADPKRFDPPGRSRQKSMSPGTAAASLSRLDVR